MHTRRMVVAVVALCTLFVSNAVASPGNRDSARPLAEMTLGASRVDWQPAGDYESIVLTVAGPEGLWFRREFAAGQPVHLSLLDQEVRLPEGSYTYELRLVLRQTEKPTQRPLLQAGSFSIRGGELVTTPEVKTPEDSTSVAEDQIRNITSATQVVPEPLVVQGGACVGSACGSSDAPAWGGLVLKDEYIALVFEDTGGVGHARDWAIQGSNIAGGVDDFSIRDVDAVTKPFSVQGAAPDYSLVVGTGGKVGVGTAIPAKKLHVLGSDGGTQGLIEETNGTTALRTMLELKNNGASRLNIIDSSVSATWGINNNSGNLNMLKSGTGVTAASLTGSGTLTVVQVVETSDRDMKTDIVAVQPEEILTKVSRLPLATWRFKKDEDKATHLGPMAQDFSAIFGLGHDDKHIKPLDVAGVSLAAVQALHRMVTEDTTQKDEEIAQLRRENANLAARLAALEALVLKGGREEAEPTPAP